MCNSIYPDDWPRCVVCGEPALDGYLTCGRAECDEKQARDREIFYDDEIDRIDE